MKFDLDLMKAKISAEDFRETLARDYGITNPASELDEFVTQLLKELDQPVSPDVLNSPMDTTKVFDAAVRAIGSNSTVWTKFLDREKRLREILFDYDPVQTARAIDRGELDSERIGEILGGQYRRAGGRAIAAWARRLTEFPDFYDVIRSAGRSFEEMDRGELQPAELMLCVAAYFADPPKRWAGEEYLGAVAARCPQAERKLPGMGPIIASEFLRNLGWNGFKPDRHVQRLLNRWAQHQLSEVGPQVSGLASLIGRRNQETVSYLKYGLVGAALTPDGISYSEADNLVWLLGANVEKKGHESVDLYLRP